MVCLQLIIHNQEGRGQLFELLRPVLVAADAEVLNLPSGSRGRVAYRDRLALLFCLSHLRTAMLVADRNKVGEATSLHEDDI